MVSSRTFHREYVSLCCEKRHVDHVRLPTKKEIHQVDIKAHVYIYIYNIYILVDIYIIQSRHIYSVHALSK